MYEAASQVIGAPSSTYVNAQLREAFDSIAPPSPMPTFLYDMSAHFVDSSWFVPINNDTSNNQIWSVIYDEIWCAQYDTTYLPRIDTVVNRAFRFGEDTVLLTLIDLPFAKMQDSALHDTTYFHIDTLNNKIYDNPSASGNPYRILNVFSGAAFPEETTSEEIIYRIDPAFLFIDSIKQDKFIQKELQLQVDFGDGGGWNNVTIDSVEHFLVTYTSTEAHPIAFRVIGTVADTTFIVGSTIFTVTSPAFDTVTPPNGLITQIEGMRVSVWNPCMVDGQDTAAKYIIFVPGFGVGPGNPMSRYKKYFVRTGLADLRNYGYTIYMVTWRNSRDFTENNAMRLVELIDTLKCNVLDQGDQVREHQFIIMGSSSGALMARYALTWMEQNPMNSPCRPDLMHNTRLFFSLDAEHQGAYVPLAFQELFNLFENPPGPMGFPATVAGRMIERVELLNSPSARELMDPHFTTRNGTLYQAHADRTAFVNDLTSLNGNGGYPEFVKMVAVSDGLLTGERQVGIEDDCVVAPGDLYLDYQATRNMFVGFLSRITSETGLQLRTLDDGEEFFSFNRDINLWRLELQWENVQRCLPFPLNNVCSDFPRLAGIDLVADNLINQNVARTSAGVPEWDVMPGSWMGAHVTVDNPINSFESLPPEFSVIDLLLDETGPVFQTGGCPIRSLNNPFPFLAGASTTRSQTLRFNFVPVQSAIDYQDNVPPDHNIFNDGANTIMANTPFDLIIGEVNGLQGYPQQQQDAEWVTSTYTGILDDVLTYPSLNRAHVTLINHLMPDTFLINDTTGTLFARYLNREIGDEELLLENLDINRRSIFQAEYDLAAGASLNRLYAYPGTPAQNVFRSYTPQEWPFIVNPYGYNLPNNGIFSASAPFTVLANADVQLISENAPQDLGITVIGPYPDMVQDTLWVCTNEYSDTSFAEGKRGRIEFVDTNALGHLNIAAYPNPVAQGSSLFFTGISLQAFDLRLIDVNGAIIIYLTASNESDSGEVQLPPDLAAGLYIVHLSNKHHNYTFKIIIQ